MKVRDYHQYARDNEEVFRNILRDLKKRGPPFTPPNIDTELELEKLLEQYSEGDRYGKFTILNFEINGNRARIDVEDIAMLSGRGAALEYQINDDNSVLYQKIISQWMS